MTKERFSEDLSRVYELIGLRTKNINSLYSLAENSDGPNYKLIKKLLKICKLESTSQNRIAVLQRLINLREDLLVLSLDGRDKAEIDEILAKVYDEVAKFHLISHKELLRQIEDEKLLTPFYRTLLFGVHEVGEALTKWQPKWTKHIINTINPSLSEEFGSDEKVAQFLDENSLFDKTGDGKNADRSYSVLIKDEGEYKNAPYAVAFGDDVKNVASKIDSLIKKLNIESDDIYEAKEAYVVYLAALRKAFLSKNDVIEAWRDADRAWMDIKTPIQLAHPLEYYEDHYKKAVALEWDVRLANPKNINADTTKERIKSMYKELFLEANGGELTTVYDKSLLNIEKTALFISRPMLYYAAQFNGLFSAQVVPNDEIVSREKGKKIFAYADNVLDSIRAKPFMKIANEVFGFKFIRNERELIFRHPNLWHQVYEITTIGHEFGHILWIDEDTELQMNKSGVFKNIEEFKATTGGLTAFFKNRDKSVLPFVISDTIKRSVGLIAWMKTPEVEPYYCESLIHLSGLFESGVLAFGERLEIDTSSECVERLIVWYLHTYLELSQHYLAKKDAKEFLDKFARKEGEVYMPTDKSVNRFAHYYWELHKSIGREIDATDRRENWLR